MDGEILSHALARVVANRPICPKNENQGNSQREPEGRNRGPLIRASPEKNRPETIIIMSESPQPVAETKPNKGGRPSKKQLAEKPRSEKTEELLDLAWTYARKKGQKDYLRIKYMQVYANLLRSAAAGKLEVDATVNLRQALEAFYGVKKG